MIANVWQGGSPFSLACDSPSLPTPDAIQRHRFDNYLTEFRKRKLQKELDEVRSVWQTLVYSTGTAALTLHLPRVDSRSNSKRSCTET